MKRLRFTIKDLSPLLQHAFGNDGDIDLPGASGHGKTRPVGAAAEQTPREVAAKNVYTNKKGQFYFPSTAITRLLRESAGSHKIKGTRKSLKYLVPSAVFNVGDEVVICNGDGKTPAVDFEVDSRPVTIPSTKGRIMRHRPRWDTWSASFEVDIDEELMDPKLIHELLVEGGKRIGLGDFRPEKGGPFGRFQVVKSETI
jgi:hypothetical protein